MTHMTFRPHTPRDFRAIADLRWRLKTEGMATAELPEKARFVERYLDHLHRQEALGQTVHWVIDEAGRVRGVMTLRRVAKETALDGTDTAWGYLTNAIVERSVRNQGLGTALLAHLIDAARAEGLEFLLVWPSAQSRSLYRRAGFEGDGDPMMLALA